MPPNLPESDWKTLSRLKPSALERLCQRILHRAQDLLAAAQEGESHRVYLDLYKHIHKSDETLVNCFDDWRRSQALVTLMNWREQNLLTDEEFASFSSETREMVDEWLARNRGG